jgi:hypothetical protein
VRGLSRLLRYTAKGLNFEVHISGGVIIYLGVRGLSLSVRYTVKGLNSEVHKSGGDVPVTPAVPVTGEECGHQGSDLRFRSYG